MSDFARFNDRLPPLVARFFWGDKPAKDVRDRIIADPKKFLKEEIVSLALLYHRAVALRSWRDVLYLSKKFSPATLRAIEDGVAWTNGYALPFPTDKNPYSLPSYALAPAFSHEAHAGHVRLYVDDVYAKKSGDLEEVLGVLMPAAVSQQAKKAQFESWKQAYRSNPAARHAALARQADDILRVNAFFEIDHEFVGMGFLKESLWGLYQASVFRGAFASAAGGDNTKSLHMAFVAKRGMGKSTVVPAVAKALRRLGLLEKDHVATLTLEKISETTLGADEKAIREAFKEGRGGVVFFDEADTAATHLARGQHRSPLIQALNAQAEMNRETTALIVATYPEHADLLLDSDQGFRSRFGDRVLHFPEYSTADFVTMFDREMGRFGFALEGDAARSRLWDYLSDLRKNQVRHFSNGRLVRDLAQHAQNVLAAKLMDQGVVLSEIYFHAAGDVERAITEDDMVKITRRFKLGVAPVAFDPYAEDNPFADSAAETRGAQVVELFPSAKPAADKP